MNTPSLCTNSLAAVGATVGDEVVSATVQVIWRPSTPPWALICLKRASIAAGESAKVEAAGPVRSLMIPTFMVLAVIPGALAVLPGAPVALDVLGTVVEVVAALLDEPHPAATIATDAATTISLAAPRRAPLPETFTLM